MKKVITIAHTKKFSNIYSPAGARGMYEVWNKMFGKLLYWLKMERLAMMLEAGEKESPEEQAKDIVEEDKKGQRMNLKEKVLLWRFLQLIYGVKKERLLKV